MEEGESEDGERKENFLYGSGDGVGDDVPEDGGDEEGGDEEDAREDAADDDDDEEEEEEEDEENPEKVDLSNGKKCVSTFSYTILILSRKGVNKSRILYSHSKKMIKCCHYAKSVSKKKKKLNCRLKRKKRKKTLPHPHPLLVVNVTSGSPLKNHQKLVGSKSFVVTAMQ